MYWTTVIKKGYNPITEESPDAPVNNGDVIVARLDGEYSTVKRMYKHGDEVRLIPDNPDCEPIIRTAATFLVGKVIDVYRPVRAKKERKI